MIRFFRTTKNHTWWWKQRKLDWRKEYQNWQHPHRKWIVRALKSFGWQSLIEIGCAAGANLIAIVKEMPGRQLGGVDVNEEAIKVASETLVGGLFRVNSADDIMLSDKATDVVLSDLCLIYVDPFKIDKYLKEIFRVARNHIVFCEFHTTNPWKRFWLKVRFGYNAYNWSKLLKKHGCYDIVKYKMPPELWENEEPQKTFAYLFIARVPK